MSRALRTEDPSRYLTRITTAACCLYIGWVAYHLGDWVKIFKSLFTGLNSMSSVALFVTNLPKGALLAGGAVLIAGLVVKEFLIENAAVRNAVNFLVFIAVNGFVLFCVDAILGTMKEIIDKIG